MSEKSYAELTAFLRDELKARAVVLMVIDGIHGNGLSIEIPDTLTPNDVAEWLEILAVQLRANAGRFEPPPRQN